MKTSKVDYSYWIIAGVVLGISSIVRWRVPFAIAQFSGLMVLGSHTGYMVLALLAAWSGRKWRDGLKKSSLAMSVATVVYYFGALLLYAFEEGFDTALSQILHRFMLWIIVGFAVSMLAATAVWMARDAKVRLLNYGIFVVAFFGMIGVVYLFQGTHVFEQATSFLLITAVLVVGFNESKVVWCEDFKSKM